VLQAGKMIVMNPDGESRWPHFKAVRRRAIKAYTGCRGKDTIYWNRVRLDSRFEDLFQGEQRKKGHCHIIPVFGVIVPPISVLLQEISMPGQETNPICRLK
jgi:hypothetical protein